MRLLVLLAAAVLAAACASAPPQAAKPELFAVVPAPDGHIGAIVVHSHGTEKVINSAYGAERIGSDGSVKTATLTPDEVKAEFG